MGRPGRRVLTSCLHDVRRKYSPDIIVCNVENAASGFGITKSVYDEILKLGVDVMTSGNHIWDVREIEGYIDKLDRLVRPANMAEELPGKGHLTIHKNGESLTVINLMGRVFMPLSDCPFKKFDSIYNELSEGQNILVDFHAEATSEKAAFAHHVDGRAAAVVGTHTHVQTADDRVLDKGTLFMSDVGMCGMYDGVIGMDKEGPVKRFLTGKPQKFEVKSKGRHILNALFFEIDNDGKITAHDRASTVTEG